MRVLLHICCAPCTIFPLTALRGEGHEVGGFFYNPNIHPYSEYEKRLDTLRGYAAETALDVIISEGYPIELFFRGVSFREEERCGSCYRLRLEQTAAAAGERGFDAFSTTLLYSKYQKHDLIREAAEEVSLKTGVLFLYRDFRQGWQQGVDVSREMNMYRQKYCGCIYSERERFLKKRKAR